MVRPKTDPWNKLYEGRKEEALTWVTDGLCLLFLVPLGCVHVLMTRSISPLQKNLTRIPARVLAGRISNVAAHY